LGEDDDGEEIQADLNISLEQYEEVCGPIFQKAVDVCKELLERNHLSRNEVHSLILVGGPTFSQTLRRMLKEQVTANIDTSIDPMTAVAKGAALFASTKSIPLDLQKRDVSKAKLSLKYPETTVEIHENLGIRIDRDKSTANLPSNFTLEVLRADSGWSSGKLAMDSDVEIIELLLNEGKANQFNIKLSGSDGTNIPCEPSSITMIHGLKIANATLPYSIGIEVYDISDSKQGVYTLSGLEKNKTLPAKGKGSFKTSKDIRPGNTQDQILIPIYEFDYGNSGSRAILNSFFGKFAITGADLPSFLPAGSEIEVTLNIDASRRGTLSIYIPAIDESFDAKIEHTIEKEVKQEVLLESIQEARQVANRISAEGNINAENYFEELNEAEKQLHERGHERDTKDKIHAKIKELFIQLDKNEAEGEWPKAAQELQDAINYLVMNNNRYGNQETNRIVSEYEKNVRTVLSQNDIKSAQKLQAEVRSLAIQV
jgi:molecular chaperone DnaK